MIQIFRTTSDRYFYCNLVASSALNRHNQRFRVLFSGTKAAPVFSKSLAEEEQTFDFGRSHIQRGHQHGQFHPESD